MVQGKRSRSAGVRSGGLKADEVFGVALALVAVLAGALDLPVAVAPMTVATSLLASALSGIVAGWYPARRATRLVVVEALRTE